MNVYALVHARILAALGALQADGAVPQGLDFGNVEVVPPRDASHGDLASNAALVLAKSAGMKPRDIADKLAEKLRADADIAKVEVAGPGFLNLSFHPGFWQGVVKAILERRGRPLAAAISAGASASTWSTSRSTRPGRCTSATGAALPSAMPCAISCSSPATT